MNSPHIARNVPRRRFLRGMGVMFSLPVLECMTPVFSRAAASKTPKRMLLISNNLGVLPQHFFPQGKGAGYALSPYLKELAAFRNDFTVFSGLSHPAVVGGHSTENCFLTAARDPTRDPNRDPLAASASAVGRRPTLAALPGRADDSGQREARRARRR